MDQGSTFEVVIIGAGFAGLAAAQELKNQNISTVILEARDRIGGRAWTETKCEFPIPVEYGAEFIHGTQSATWSETKRLGIEHYQCTGAHQFMEHGKPSPNGGFAETQSLFKKLNSQHSPDRSFADFLNAQPNSEKADRSRMYVEGFHAADSRLIGEQYLAKIENGAETEDLEEDSFRLKYGYQDLLKKFADGLEIRFNSAVQSVEWEPGLVRCHLVTGQIVTAKRVVIAVPFGVLKSGTLRFQPEFPERECIFSKLEMGYVHKFLIHFKSRFWERVAGKNISFFHSNNENVPTWWTYAPLDVPVLAGWVGGPKALHLSGQPESEQRRIAVESLADIFGLRVSEVQDQIMSMEHHDWNMDPYSMGSYSYVGVEGLAAQARLAEPFLDTLFIAGELTETKEQTGTTDAAISSGKRAARQIISSASAP